MTRKVRATARSTCRPKSPLPEYGIGRALKSCRFPLSFTTRSRRRTVKCNQLEEGAYAVGIVKLLEMSDLVPLDLPDVPQAPLVGQSRRPVPVVHLHLGTEQAPFRTDPHGPVRQKLELVDDHLQLAPELYLPPRHSCERHH